MAIHSFGKRNSTDLKVRFDGHFADGQTASLVVSENTVLHGNRVVLDIAHEGQQQGRASGWYNCKR